MSLPYYPNNYLLTSSTRTKFKSLPPVLAVLFIPIIKLLLFRFRDDLYNTLSFGSLSIPFSLNFFSLFFNPFFHSSSSSAQLNNYAALGTLFIRVSPLILLQSASVRARARRRLRYNLVHDSGSLKVEVKWE